MSTIRNKITLACVPEQVNIPIAMMLEKSIALGEHNLDVEVKYVPEGTGKMLDMLESREADVALAVTDAFLVANAKGRPVQLAGTFVSSPLVWAIAASPSLPAEITSLHELVDYRAGQPLRVGISRLGSGSHTMASYLAMLHNLQCPLTFHVANNLSGLTKGIQSADFDIFLWETFTTKPLFDRQELRYIGEVPTPWPAFSFVTRKFSGDGDEGLIPILQYQLFPALFEAARLFVCDTDFAVDRIVKEFGHKAADATQWLRTVRYNESAAMAVRLTTLKLSVEILQRVGLIASDVPFSPQIWQNAVHAHDNSSGANEFDILTAAALLTE